MTNNIIIDSSTIIALIVMIAQVLKCNFGFIKPKHIPAINVVLGCILNFLIMGSTDIPQGVVLGMSASGFYDICCGFRKDKKNI